MKLRILASAVVLLAMSGCQTPPYQPYARSVKLNPQKGGVIALRVEHNTEDRAKADTMMKMNCADKPIKVLEEGEVVVGTVTDTSGESTRGEGKQKAGKLFGMQMYTNDADKSSSRSETSQKKEWQISYECSAEVAATKKTR